MACGRRRIRGQSRAVTTAAVGGARVRVIALRCLNNCARLARGTRCAVIHCAHSLAITGKSFLGLFRSRSRTRESGDRGRWLWGTRTKPGLAVWLVTRRCRSDARVAVDMSAARVAVDVAAARVAVDVAAAAGDVSAAADRLDVAAPNAERRTPNAERRTPNAERRTPNAERDGDGDDADAGAEVSGAGPLIFLCQIPKGSPETAAGPVERWRTAVLVELVARPQFSKQRRAKRVGAPSHHRNAAAFCPRLRPPPQGATSRTRAFRPQCPARDARQR